MPVSFWFNTRPCTIQVLRSNTGDLVNRWQKDNPLLTMTIMVLPFRPLRISMIGDYSLKERAIRYGYAYYKEFCRLRFKEAYDDKLFKKVIKITKQKVSTTEPSNNFPDLFMTKQKFVNN